MFDGLSATSIASLLGMVERSVIVDGFSKREREGRGGGLAMGSCRTAAERVRLFETHAFGCTLHASQIAAVEALTGPQDHVTMMVEQY